MYKKLQHLLRYGTHSEKDIFTLPSEENDYDEVVLNANMVAYTPKAMSAFVLRLDRPFIIDPQTHVFQHDFQYLLSKNGNPKQSVSNLAEKYGGQIKEAFFADMSIDPNTFSDPKERDFLVRNVVDFQKNTLTETITQGAAADYVTFALDEPGSKLSKDHITPQTIIAPYFFLDERTQDVLQINIDLANHTHEVGKSEGFNVGAELVISKSLLRNDVYRKKVIDEYAKLAFETIFIWIDEFDETVVGVDDLSAFKDLVTNLSLKGKKVVNLYGGYFSLLLSKIDNGLVGVCHGMEYGESRKVVPVSGGLPKAKYYFPPLHIRMKAESYARTIEHKKGWRDLGAKDDSFAREVCDCKSCEDPDQFIETITFEIKSKKGVKRRGETSTTAAKRHSLKHYLINKTREYDLVRKNELTVLLEDLRKSLANYKKTDDVVSHLSRWLSVLDVPKKKNNT